MNDQTVRSRKADAARAFAVVALGAALLGGCASKGDLDQVRQETLASSQSMQASLESTRQQLASSEQQLMASLAKDREGFAALAKENELLRATLGRVVQAFREYIRGESAHHEQALARIRAAEQALK